MAAKRAADVVAKRAADAAEHVAKHAKRDEYLLFWMDIRFSALMREYDNLKLEYAELRGANRAYVEEVAAKAGYAAASFSALRDQLVAVAALISPSDLGALPMYCLAHMLRFLDAASCTRVARTCKLFAELVCANSTTEHAKIRDAGVYLEHKQLVDHAARRHPIEWNNVRAVTVDCEAVTNNFTHDKWRDLTRFVEGHVPRMYPQATRITLKSRLWPQFIVGAKDYRLSVPGRRLVELLPTIPRHRPHYTDLVHPATISILRVDDSQDMAERTDTLRMALLHDQTPSLRTLELSGEQWYSAMINAVIRTQFIPISPSVLGSAGPIRRLLPFKCATGLTVHMRECAIEGSGYDHTILQQLLKHTAELTVFLSNPSMFPKHNKLMSALFEALVQLKCVAEQCGKEYIVPRIYVHWHGNLPVLHASGAFGFAEQLPLYVVLQPHAPGDTGALEVYVKNEYTKNPLIAGKPPTLFFATGTKQGAINRVPPPYCETIEGTLRYDTMVSKAGCE